MDNEVYVDQQVPSGVITSIKFKVLSEEDALLGNAKGAVAVVVSIMTFKNPVLVTRMLGYLMTVLGVILYSEAKKRTK